MSEEPRFRRTREGMVMTLGERERRDLASITAETRALVASEPSGHPAIERLFPRAYLDPTEDDAEREWQGMVHPDLREGRLTDFDTLLAVLDRAESTGRSVRAVVLPAETEHVLAAVNAVRIVLATSLGVTGEQGHDDPRLAWLDDIEMDLVEALTEVP